MPDMLMNPYKAYWAEQGTGIEGKPPIKYTENEKVVKAMGFTPTREAETYKAQEIAREKRQQRLDKVTSFAERYLQAKKRKDTDAIRQIRKDLKAWNRKQHGLGREGLPIRWKKDVLKSASRRKKARSKGYEDRMPKYMRKFQKEVSSDFGLTQ